MASLRADQGPRQADYTTTDFAIAKRRLVEFRAKAGRLEGHENRHIRFEELAKEWLASVQSDPQPKS